MKLPNLSKAMDVACMRYVQSIHEPPERRNPDTVVGRFIPRLKRWRLAWIGREELSNLRAEPFYYYVGARTRYYDQVLSEAVADGVKQIALVGCGTDSRAYRFEELLQGRCIRVLECDQAEIIRAKERLADHSCRNSHVDYVPLDLNDDAWPELKRWLGGGAVPKTLVMMEGVSAYVDEQNLGRFLRFLATTLPPGSHVAYDFKIRGVNDELGWEGRTVKPFRLSPETDEVRVFHEALGFRFAAMELSAGLTTRLMPGLVEGGISLFSEDVLVRLVVFGSDTPASGGGRREGKARIYLRDITSAVRATSRTR